MKGLIFLILTIASFSASAQTYYWVGRTSQWTPTAACESYRETMSDTQKQYFKLTVGVSGASGSCSFDESRDITYGRLISLYYTIKRYGDSCVTGKVYNESTGFCESPPEPENPCTSKQGQATNWKKTWASFEAYTSMGERANQGGCAVTISSMECGSNASGEFACWGSGTYTGDQDTTSGTVDDCLNPAACTPPEPTTSDSSQDCSVPTTNGSTTTYTCVTSSSAEQFAGSNCAYGEVNGTSGYHCTKPDYVPASDSQTRTDDVSETTNPDGSKTTTTTSTTHKTYCESGACNTTTTTTTTTKGTDAAGNPTGETTTCTGDECKGPEDPKDGKMPGTVPGPSTAEAFPKINNGNETPSYADTTEAFYDRISGAPIVAALGTIHVPTGGSCNIGSASLFGGSVSFDHFCDMAPQVFDGLRYLFLAIWAWAAIRLFFTA